MVTKAAVKEEVVKKADKKTNITTVVKTAAKEMKVGATIKKPVKKPEKAQIKPQKNTEATTKSVLPTVEEMLRDEAPRQIANRILQGGDKKTIMADLIANDIPLKTEKTPEQALVQDIPYVVRRLKEKGYKITKEGRAFVLKS
jgi:hypothetical protein